MDVDSRRWTLVRRPSNRLWGRRRATSVALWLGPRDPGKAQSFAGESRDSPRVAPWSGPRTTRFVVPRSRQPGSYCVCATNVAARADRLEDAAAAIQNCLDDDTSAIHRRCVYNGVVPARFTRTPRSCLNPTGYATLGYALPAGIGAKLAQPDRQLAVVSGDGGILFTVAELSVAVDLKLPLPIVVLNNHGYGEIRQAMISHGIEPFGVTFEPPRFPSWPRLSAPGVSWCPRQRRWRGRFGRPSRRRART